jgi:hypothetical protein
MTFFKPSIMAGFELFVILLVKVNRPGMRPFLTDVQNSMILTS